MCADLPFKHRDISWILYTNIIYLYDVFSVSPIWMALIRICFVWDWRWHSAGNCQWQIPATSNERILEITALNHIILRANCCQIWKVMDVLCYFPILHVHRNVMWYHESKWYPKVVGNQRLVRFSWCVLWLYWRYYIISMTTMEDIWNIQPMILCSKQVTSHYPTQW